MGLGNIAGVAIAIQLGGPGAMFWMTVAGLLGMSSKFVECTLGQKYRIVKPDGSVSGGAMYYLSRGLGELGLRPLGKVLAPLFAVVGLSVVAICSRQTSPLLRYRESYPFCRGETGSTV